MQEHEGHKDEEVREDDAEEAWDPMEERQKECAHASRGEGRSEPVEPFQTWIAEPDDKKAAAAAGQKKRSHRQDRARIELCQFRSHR